MPTKYQTGQVISLEAMHVFIAAYSGQITQLIILQALQILLLNKLVDRFLDIGNLGRKTILDL